MAKSISLQTLTLLLISSVACATKSDSSNLRRKLQNDQCSVQGNPVNTHSTLLVNFNGSPDNIVDEDYLSIGEAFVTAYQSLATDLCFSISDVTIDTQTEEEEEEDEDERRMSASSSQRGQRREQEDYEFDFSFFYLINYECWYCGSGSPLLGPDASRRQLILSKLNEYQDILPENMYRALLDSERDVIGEETYQLRKNQSSSLSSSQRRSLQDYSPDPVTEGPPRSDFLSAYNEILELPAYANLPINRAKQTSEIEEINCGSEENEMESAFVIQFRGDYDYIMENPDGEEIKVIKRAVKKAYNTLNMANPDTCDTFFRRIDRAIYVGAEYFEDDMFTMTFNLKFSSRGEQEELSLFDPDFPSFESTSVDRNELNVDYRELGPLEPDCVCDIFATTNRGPTKTEFAHSLRDIVGIRRGKGKLSFITHVGFEDENEEHDDSDTATEIPWVEDTAPPSAFPSQFAPPLDRIDENLYYILQAYPYYLQEEVFEIEDDALNNGDDSMPPYPIMTIPNGWPYKEKGLFDIVSQDCSGSIFIEEILWKWGNLKDRETVSDDLYGSKPVKQFMKGINFEAAVVKGEIYGSKQNNAYVPFVGILANYDEEGSLRTIFLPLQEFISHDVDETCIDTFEQTAFSQRLQSCGAEDPNEIFKVNVKNSCLEEFDAETKLGVMKARDETQLHANNIAFGLGYCLQNFMQSDEELSLCLRNVHDKGIVARLVELEERDPETYDCEDLTVELAEECFSCDVCSADEDPEDSIECCSDEDCESDGICNAYKCFPNGSLRFTLTWEGKDDYDLHVIAPITKIDIYSENPNENIQKPKKGGKWKARKEAKQGEKMKYYAEQIWFPSCEGGEEYEFYVEQVEGVGNKWILTVHVEDELRDSYAGEGEAATISFSC